MQIVLPRPQRTLLSPTEIAGLAAWYDVSGEASTTSNNIRIDASNRVSLIADKSGNSATLVWANNGGTVASQSVSAANKSVTGSFPITMDLRMETTRPAADRTVIDKLSGNNGFQVVILTTGVVRLRIGNSVTVTNVDSTVALTSATFTRVSVGITWVDGVGASFTQNGAALGSDVAAAVSLTNAAVSCVIGRLQGVFYRVQVGSFYDCNPALATGKLVSSFSSGGDTWTIASANDLGARVCGERDLVQLTAAKQPIYLPWSGTNYGWLPGAAASYFATAHSASYNVSAFALSAEVAAADYTPSSVRALISKPNEYSFRLLTTGQLSLFYYPGGVFNSATSSASVSTSDRARGYFGVTRDSATGTIRFWTSTNGSTWSQLGTDVAGATGAITATTNGVEVGSRSATELFIGEIYSARLVGSADLNGTAIFNFNPALYQSGTTFTASTGETWTLNGRATIVNRTSLYFDGSDDYLGSPGFQFSQPQSNYLVAQQVSWTASGTLFDGRNANTMALIQDDTGGGSPNLLAFSSTATARNGNLPIGATGIITTVFNGASSLLRVNRGAASTGNTGERSPGAQGFILGIRGTIANAANIRFNEAILRSAADATAVQDRFILRAGQKWGVQV